MGRPKRADEGGLIHYVLNRANARMTIFEKDGDYEAFELVLEEAVDRTQTRLLAYCVMPNHWHLIVWPHQDGAVSRFVGWPTLTHTQRWHAHRHTRGERPRLSAPVQVVPGPERRTLSHRLPLRRAQRFAGEPGRASRRLAMVQPGSSKAVDSRGASRLSAWPLERPRNWVELVNAAQTEAELSALPRSVRHGCPFGEASWSDQMVRRLGLEVTLRPQGRRKKQHNGS
jgi:putative transposase